MSELGSSDEEEAFSTVNVGSNNLNSEGVADSISMSELDSEKDLDKDLPLVYAIGELSYDFGTEIRLKSFREEMNSEKKSKDPKDPPRNPRNPRNPSDLLEHLSVKPDKKDHPIVTRKGGKRGQARIILLVPNIITTILFD